jgi:hypothetical protein
MAQEVEVILIDDDRTQHKAPANLAAGFQFK